MSEKLIRSIKVLAPGTESEHLIGWWKLDEGNETVAKDNSLSQEPHDGKLINSPVWAQASGQSVMALQFNGADQYVSLSNILQESYTEISIACWMKHDRTGNQVIVMRSLWDNPAGIGLYLMNNAAVTFGHFTCNVTSKADVQDDQWHHVVGTMCQSGGVYTYSVYVDGKLDNPWALRKQQVAGLLGRDIMMEPRSMTASSGTMVSILIED